MPTFSDLSHLLTHVSSKGHLSHLHKLQVKSHQEIGAAVQLTNYNQWYQQHGLANLLSERMQQKEQKQWIKNGNDMIKKRARSVKDEGASDNGFLRASPSHRSRRGRPGTQMRHSKREDMEDDGSDLDYAPAPRARRPRKPAYYTPVKRIPSLTSSPPEEDDSLEIDPALISTPTPKHAKLKGKIWPGMDLFDAATPEEQRKRNQKKDGSVLRRMERLSRLVDPQETVFSPSFTIRKQRHIDNLEDDSSLIEGETPITKPKPRSRRKPLVQVSGNIPRFVRRKPKAVKTRSQRRQENSGPLPNTAHIPNSLIHASGELQSGYTPTADENMEFQLAVGNLPLRKRAGNFTIFTDNDSPTDNMHRVSAYGPFQQSTHHNYHMPTQPKLMYPNAPWLQPQNQNPIYLPNQYPRYRTTYTGYQTYQPYQDASAGKENMVPMAERALGSDYHIMNPLKWKSPVANQDSQSSESSFGTFSGYFASTSGLADPFGYSRNPLLDTLVHYNAEQNVSPTRHDALPDHYGEANHGVSKRDTQSPHDTISELNSQE